MNEKSHISEKFNGLTPANEIAVSAFLNGKISFTDIYKINAQTLESATYTNVQSLDEILECDKLARISASEFITKVAH